MLAPKALSAPTNDNAATAIDANADGHPDLLAAGNGGVVVNLNAGDGTFALPTPVSIDGAVASTIQLGDVNGDGHADLITGTASGAYLSLGSADGTFGAPTLISTGNVISIALGDVTGDGSMDLALGIAGNGLGSGVSNLSIFVNDGHGNFTLRETVDARTGLTNGVGPSQLVLKDLNGDGKADLVYRRLGDYNGTTFTNSGVAVALSNASGTAFGVPTIFAAGIDVQQAQHGIAVGDVDGDGHLDIVTIASGVFTSSSTPSSNGGLFVLHGNGDGAFAAAVPLTFPDGTGLSADSLALTDVNHDGHLDIVATRSTSATQAGSTDNTFVLLNDGAGGFAAPVAYAGAINPRSVSVGDLNGDGIPDLVINENQTFDTSGLEVLLGRSDGTFAPRTTYYVADTSDAIAVGDIDGDGKLDVA